MMKTAISSAVMDFDKTCEEVIRNCEPVTIIRKDSSNVVLISEAEYNSLLETVYLLGVPGMKERLSEGLRTPVGECDDFEW